MAAELTPQMAADVQTMMANVEAAYRSTNAARTALSRLITVGKATCFDIQKYNLQVKAVYAYQASVAGIIKAQGGQAPAVPAPIYVVWKGISGDQAANIDCNAAQMRGAVLGAPTGPTSFVNPAHVEWRQEALPADNAMVLQIVQRAGAQAIQPRAGLGIAPLVVVAIIIVGIVVTVTAYIVLKIVEALTDVPGKVQTTKQVAIQAAEHQKTLEQRASCYTDCANRGKDPVECAKACDRLTPGFVAQYPGGGWGILGTLAGVAVLGLVAYAGYKAVKSGAFQHYAGGARGAKAHHSRQLPSGGHDDDDDYIDAEYEERAA